MKGSQRKKLLVISPSYPPIKGGISDYAQQLARALSNLYEVSILTSKSLGETEWKNIFVENSMLTWKFTETIKLINAVRKIKPNVVLFQDGDDYRSIYVTNLYFLMMIPFFIRFLLRCPIFLIIHEGVGKRQFIQANLSTGVIVVEKNYLDWFAKFGKIQPNAKWIPIGSNIPRAELTSIEQQKVRENLGVGDRDIAIGFFGFINPRKGFDVLINSLEILSEQFSVKLIIIGEPSEIPRSTSFQIKWTGYLDPLEVGRVLASMNVCVFPFPQGAYWRYTSLLAALVQDVPVVTAPGLKVKLDGLYEYIPGDPFSLSEKIREALTLKSSEKIKRHIHNWTDQAICIKNFIDESLC